MPNKVQNSELCTLKQAQILDLIFLAVENWTAIYTLKF